MLKTFFYTFLTCLVPVLSGATDRIIPSQDLTYTGSFLPPAGTRNGTDYGYADTAGLGYNEDAGGIIVKGTRTDHPTKAEVVSIPTLVTDHSYNTGNLNRGAVLTSFADPMNDGAGDTIQINGLNNAFELGGLEYISQQTGQDGGKYYWSGYNFYEVSPTEADTLGWTDDDMTSNSVGVWGTPYHQGYYSQSFLEINHDWADTNIVGKYLGMSRARASHSMGPTLYALAPWQDNSGTAPANGAELETVKLISYDTTHLLESWSRGIMVTSIDATWATIGSKQAYVVLLTGSFVNADRKSVV